MRTLVIFILLIVYCLHGAYDDDYGDFDSELLEFDSEEGDTIDGLEFVASQKKPSSHLETVYQKLAIVTRITSAIALQAAGIRKSVLIRDVITELLRAPSEDFSKLAQIDPSPLVTFLENSYSASKEMQEKLKAKGVQMKTLESKEEVLDLISSTYHYVKETYTDVDLAAHFLKDLGESEFKTKTMACDTNLVKLVIDFSSILDEYPDLSNLTDLIDQVNSSSTQISDCFKILNSYNTTVAHYREEFKIFEKLGDAKKGIQAYEKNKDDVKDFQNTMDLVKTVYSTTEKFWSKEQTFGETIVRVDQYLDNILASNIKPELSLTLGFPEHGDMAKVSKDLRSDWFKQKIAHGQSINGLGRALLGFFKFGRKMRTLEKSWVILRKNYTNKESKPLMKVLVKNLAKAGLYSGSSEDLKIVDKSKKAFDECWKDLEAFNEAQLNKLDRELAQVNKVMKQVENIENKAFEFKEELDQTAVKSVFRQLAKAKFGDGDNENKLKIIKKFSNIDSITKLGVKFKDLQESQNILKEHLDTLDNSNLINATQNTINLLRGSTIKSNLDCLVGKKTEFDPTRLLEMMQFSKIVYDVANETQYLSTKNVLEKFSKMRKDLLDVEQFVKDIGPKYYAEHSKNDYNPVLKLGHSQEMALSLGKGMFILRDMVRAIRYRPFLLDSSEIFNSTVSKKIDLKNQHDDVKEFWKNSKSHIKKLVGELDALNDFAGKIEGDELSTLKKVLDESIKVQGFPEVFKRIYAQFENYQKYPDQKPIFKKLSQLDLDFASHKGYLHAASMSFDELRKYFDEVFELDDQHHEVEHNHLAAILICLTIFLIIIVACLIVYSRTKSGRTKIKNLYLYYFGKPEVFEKRWRYSFFMDRQDGKNALLDAAREINPTNVMKAVKKGAYINVYNKHGNTPLHVATKRGYPEIVEILIKNGADRTLQNAYNETAEQMIPLNYRVTHPDKIERFEKIEKIYKKHRNKKFRIRVPNEFPVSSFHVYIDKETDNMLTDKFMEKFQSIIADETSNSTTHFVVKTQPDGSLETNDLDLISWVLSGVIIVKDTWMSDCLKDQNRIENDWDYLIEKVKYKGIVYDTIRQWTQSMAKGQMPFLHGVYVFVMIYEYPNMLTLTSMVTAHGGVMCQKLMDKNRYNEGFRPYLHANMGPFFIIHDGKLDVDVYKNDADGMYTLFTEEEFVHFMLRREVQQNTNPKPTPALNTMED